MPILTNSESYAFNEDLNRYQAQEIAADKRADWVGKRILDLMVEEYNPFLPSHVTEAMSELCWPDACMLGAYLTAAAKNPTNQSAQVHLADFVVRVCDEYWRNMAKSHAEDEYDKGGLK